MNLEECREFIKLLLEEAVKARADVRCAKDTLHATKVELKNTKRVLDDALRASSHDGEEQLRLCQNHLAVQYVAASVGAFVLIMHSIFFI